MLDTASAIVATGRFLTRTSLYTSTRPDLQQVTDWANALVALAPLSTSYGRRIARTLTQLIRLALEALEPTIRPLITH